MRKYYNSAATFISQTIQRRMVLFPESLKGFIGTLDKGMKQSNKPKSAGTDGLTVEFYSFFWHHIRSLLYSAYLECISSTNLSPTMKQGLITLIPKPNKNKLHDMKRSLSRWLTRDITVFGSRPLQS